MAEQIRLPLPPGCSMRVGCCGHVLAFLFHRSDIPIHLVHLHHGMCPDSEASVDQVFVRDLAGTAHVLTSPP